MYIVHFLIQSDMKGVYFIDKLILVVPPTVFMPNLIQLILGI